MREVCGTVSGMFMAAGLAFASTSDSPAKKGEHYKRIQELAEEYKKENGSIICRELLGLTVKGADNPTPEVRTAEYYKKRPCKELVEMAADILDTYIKNNATV